MSDKKRKASHDPEESSEFIPPGMIRPRPSGIIIIIIKYFMLVLLVSLLLSTRTKL